MEPRDLTPSEAVEAAFADSVAQARTGLGWSQEKLAEEMRKRGVDEANALLVSRIENRRRRVPLVEALVLSEIFGIPLPVLTSVAGANSVRGVIVASENLVRTLESRVTYVDRVAAEVAEELQAARTLRNELTVVRVGEEEGSPLASHAELLESRLLGVARQLELRLRVFSDNARSEVFDDGER